MFDLLVGCIGGGCISALCFFYIWRKKELLSNTEAGIIFRGGTPNRVTFTDTVLMPFFERIERVALHCHTSTHVFAHDTALYTKNWQKIDITLEIEVRLPRDRKTLKRILDVHELKVLADASFYKERIQKTLEVQLPDFIRTRDAQDWILCDRERLAQDLHKILSQGLEIEVLSVSVTNVRTTAKSHYNSEHIEDRRGLAELNKELTELEDLETTWKNIQEEKKQVAEETKALHVKQLALQAYKLEVEGEEASLYNYIEQQKDQLRVQIDLLKTHLDVALTSYKREASHQSSSLGMITPKSIDRESDKLRNRFCIEVDSWERERADKLNRLHDKYKKGTDE